MGFFSNATKFVMGGGVPGAYATNSSFKKKADEFLFGKDAKDEQYSTLTPNQQRLSDQRANAISGPGAKGAYGTSADFYRDQMNPNGQNYQQLSAPMIRDYNEDIVPDVGEQFAGMGSGATSSSGFRNSLVRSNRDLNERLGMLRQNQRMQGAQGLYAIGQQGLQQETENVHRPATEGFVNTAANAAGQAAVKYVTGGGGG